MSTNFSNASLALSLESELSKVKENLKGVDESLKRLTGRDFPENRIERRIYNSNRDLYNTNREKESAIKKKGPTGIFARLGAPILDVNRRDNRENRHKLIDFSSQKEDGKKMPTLSSSVARPVNDGKSRSEAAAELTHDRASRDRNRRMFGALLGTLQRFQNDEAKQKDKEDQRAAIEKKLEEKGKAEKEEMRRERIDLFNQRKEQQANIKRLQYKMMRVKEHEGWETHQKKLRKFIRTVSKPNIFWLPKVSTTKSSELIKKTKTTIDDELEDKRNQLKDELERVITSRKDSDLKEESEEEAEMPKLKKPKLEEDNLDETLAILEDNCDDILDFEVEEPRQVEEVCPSGKGSNPERVVVQVASGINGLGNISQRKVELVPVNRNGMKEPDMIEVKNESDAREIKIVKKERVKLRKSSKSENVENVIVDEPKEHKSVESVKDIKEIQDKEEDNKINVAEEKCTIKESDMDCQETDIKTPEKSITPVPEQTEHLKSPSKSPPVIVESIIINEKKSPEPEKPISTPEKIKIHSPSHRNHDSTSSSSSDDSDDFDDSSSTSSDSESSESDSSDSTSSTSTDSEVEKKRDQRRKSVLAARKREEERRKKHVSSNSSSDDEKIRDKGRRGGSPRDKRSASTKSSLSKRSRRSDDRQSKDKRKRSRSRDRDRHRGRSGEHKLKK